jgi:uncharacterized OsmC-like protein
MSERIVFWQNSEFNVQYQYRDPNNPDSSELENIQGLHQVTPYGMMLFSLATCTAQVVLSFAVHHGIDLESVKMDLLYEKNFQDDCESCLEEKILPEAITGTIAFSGKISEAEKTKLLKVSRQCPIENILEQGIPIRIRLAE